METHSRLKKLSPPPSAELERRKAEALARGIDVIDLGCGEPDLPTPAPIVEAAKAALDKPEHHRDHAPRGSLALRAAVARYYERRFSVELDPETQVVVLAGSRDGLTRAPQALVEPGQTVLLPDPCAPVFRSAAALAGLETYALPLRAERRFLPELGAVPKDVAYHSKLLFLGYPNDPTGAAADLGFFQSVADWATRHQVWVAHDASHSEMAFDRPHPSVLQAKGALSVSVEFGSLSKTFNMAGWRVGWAVGASQAVAALARAKEPGDAGVFGAIQEAAAWALDHGDTLADVNRRAYAVRKQAFVAGLSAAGWRVYDTPASYYVWTRTPAGLSSRACVERLLDDASVLAAPGAAFGPSGEGCVRFALTAPEKRLEDALRRIARIRWPNPRPAETTSVPGA